jgi:hypothetical protein
MPVTIAELFFKSQFKTPTLDALIDVKSVIHPIADALSSFERKLGPFTDLAALMAQADLLKDAGWIPHPALPIKDLVAAETDISKIRCTVQLHVDSNKEEIYELLTKRFADYTLHEETSELCDAVIRGHRYGLFPLITPSVFSEIERCARIALGASPKQKSKKIIDGFVSKINNIPISHFDVVQVQSLILMEDFIYETITPGSDVALPHRHGAQHGIVRFNTSRDSLNAIFLLDFVLQCCDAIQQS